MMAEMPEDALHELMMAAEMMREGGGDVGVQPGLADRGVMPGELLDEEAEVFEDAEDGDVNDPPHRQPDHDDDRVDTEEEEEEEEDVAVSMTTQGLLFLNFNPSLADAYPYGSEPPQPTLGRCPNSARIIR